MNFSGCEMFEKENYCNKKVDYKRYKKYWDVDYKIILNFILLALYTLL